MIMARVIMMSEDIREYTDGRYTLMFDEHTFFVWDNEKEERMTASQVTKKLNKQEAIIEGLKEKLCELGVSDVKINGKRMDIGLEEWLE